MNSNKKIKNVLKFETFLNERISDSQRVAPGQRVSCVGRQDSITFKGEIGQVVKDNGYMCLIKFPTRFDTSLHDGNGTDPTNCSYNIIKELLTIVDDDNIYIYITEDLFEIFNKMKDCKLAELYISITKGVDKDKIKDNYINYLDIESDGTISFLKQKWWGEAGDAMTSKKRDKVRINRAIRGILKDDYIDSIITQPDVEKFMNTFNMIFKPLEVIELRGDDILRAYNYTSELNLDKFSASCANLQPGQLQNKKIFDVYTKNTNNMAVVVVIDYGRIVGRRTIQQGPLTRCKNPEDLGKIYTFVGLFYGEGGYGSKYDQSIKKYINEKYPFSDFCGSRNNDNLTNNAIKIENTRFERYPPFDYMYVNFKTNEMADSIAEFLKHNRDWTQAYAAICPIDLLKTK